MIQLDAAVTLLGYVGIVSVAAERVVEMMKPLIYKYISEEGRKFVYYITAGSAGAAMHVLSGQPFPYFATPTTAAVMVGLLTSGGSGVWHELLGILRNFSSGIPKGK